MYPNKLLPLIVVRSMSAFCTKPAVVNFALAEAVSP
jgi:hypothetical protein